jgi:hypothetical protein
MRATTFFTTISLMLLGTMTLAQSVTYDFDALADFSKFRTYTWVRGNPVPDELNHRRIVQAIEAQLSLKGLSKADANGNPDVLVAYHASFDTDLQISAIATGWGPYRWGGGNGVARAQEVLVGTLAVDIVDARTKNIVWRAMASSDLDVDAKPEKRAKNIQKTSEKMFKNYPPKR